MIHSQDNLLVFSNFSTPELRREGSVGSGSAAGSSGEHHDDLGDDDHDSGGDDNDLGDDDDVI